VGGKAGRGGVSSGTVDGMVTTKEGAGAGGTRGGRGRRGVGSDGVVTTTSEPWAADRGANSMRKPAVTKCANIIKHSGLVIVAFRGISICVCT